jgi:hypothetical protein
MFRISVLVFLFLSMKHTLIAQSAFATLDSVMIHLNDVKWQEMDYKIEWHQPVDSTTSTIDSSLAKIKIYRIYPMLMFSDIYKINDSSWEIFCYPYRIRDEAKHIMSIPTYAPLRGNAQLVNEKIIIIYSQGDITDEILFFDKKTLVIRHITPEKIECIRYKRSD